MESTALQYKPIEGKTYSLFGNSDSTEGYYQTIRRLADLVLSENSVDAVMDVIKKYSSKRVYLKKAALTRSTSVISTCLRLINPELKQFTAKTKEHLSGLPAINFWDPRLSTTEEQYHLYMIEIELTNRLNRSHFLDCDKKISLQPYCLQDFSVKCKAQKNGYDGQCRFCSQNCYQNHASRILKDSNVEPYIWMGANIRNIAKQAFINKQTLGIIGIACIPELVWGLRKCRKYNIPVIGLPLNANCCVRWFGEFHQNSIDLNELRKLVTRE